MQDVYKILTKLEIAFHKYEHEPMWTVSQASMLTIDSEGLVTKSLLVRDNKHINYFLVITGGTVKLELERLAGILGVRRLSLASLDDLKEKLGVSPGSVSPFSLIYDLKHEVKVVIGSELSHQKLLGFHPNINTETLVISYDDLLKFVNFLGNKIQIVE